jgi:hypothetical protein
MSPFAPRKDQSNGASFRGAKGDDVPATRLVVKTSEMVGHAIACLVEPRLAKS